MIGIDLGSRQVKMIQMQQGQVIRREMADTIGFYRQYGRVRDGQLQIDLLEAGWSGDQVVATGYGKMAVSITGAQQIPEIQAHALGAVFQSQRNSFTLIDIGGQDSKVILIRDGKVVDFLTNDRCAASSGRYLENMANVLDISLEELAGYDQDPAEINATCAIFGETELVARIVEGFSLPQLAAGVNYALYHRLAPLLKRMDSDLLVLSGGVALNQALTRILERETGREVLTLPDPQYNGAIGCCVFGGI
ncbi:MAG: acyl-CoA dehydratase activase [Syntrophomonadaceae bacterium]|jgi:predicted CoA-substrate-specific enzyme activase|nr:acyl-CoA dehydratase activase [Bacillota bacterium]HAA09017.1 2-hydroxyglutaryl-CoA dehydratase [Syntrophomonas sp.]HQA49127.1 acyl-CoA dehydratase activase [Syntrophomonadaceae bacterium]HQD89502.1 acyl-CoA dehydratase activase [Syntrophomonadaceae bacterium]